MFFKIGALKNFVIFTGKHMRWSPSIKLKALQRASNTVAVMGILPKFYERFFYRTPPLAASTV